MIQHLRIIGLCDNLLPCDRDISLSNVGWIRLQFNSKLGVVVSQTMPPDETRWTETTTAYKGGGPHWPFFHRMRIDYKKQHFKDPTDSACKLSPDDMIDANVEESECDVQCEHRCRSQLN